jgi:MFS family permease
MGLVVLVVTVMIAFLGLTLVSELFLAEKVLHGGTTGYALLITAWTGGMTLGTIIAGRLKPSAVAPGIIVGLVVLGLGVAAGALSATMWMAIVAYGIGGIGDGVQMVGARTLLLQRSPAHIAGRTVAIFTGLTMGAICLGTAAAAPMVALLGIRGTVFAAGMASVVAALVAVAFGVHRLRGVPETGSPLSGAPALI